MAVYKVIQDVEAEDKIVGPLSLKQLIYAAIAFGTVFIAFRLTIATGAFYVAIPFVPIVLIFSALAAPFSRDQSTEMWLAAQIRFYTKPRTRIWDQSGIKNLVNITAPPKIEKIYTDGLNQDQVRSRLKALSSTLDSRGWAVKNVDINLSADSVYDNYSSDRIIDPSSLPIMVSDVDVRASDDILDASNNGTAQHFDELMQQSSKEQHQKLIAKMQQAAVQAPATTPAVSYPDDTDDVIVDGEEADQSTAAQDQPWSQGKEDVSQYKTIADLQPVAAPANADLSDTEKQILERAHQQRLQSQVQYASHHRVVLTAAQQAALAKQQQLDEQTSEIVDEQPDTSQETHLSKADTIELANANLKVSTIQGLAKHKIEEKQDPTEVVVRLH